MSEMLEKATQEAVNAFYQANCWDALDAEIYDDWQRAIRAALLALREPTEGMLNAGVAAPITEYRPTISGLLHGQLIDQFRAMIDAALTETQETSE